MKRARPEGRAHETGDALRKACAVVDTEGVLYEGLRGKNNDVLAILRKAREDAEKSLQSLGAGFNLPGMPF